MLAVMVHVSVIQSRRSLWIITIQLVQPPEASVILALNSVHVQTRCGAKWIQGLTLWLLKQVEWRDNIDSTNKITYKYQKSKSLPHYLIMYRVINVSQLLVYRISKWFDLMETLLDHMNNSFKPMIRSVLDQSCYQ